MASHVEKNRLACPVEVCTDLLSPKFDAVVVVTDVPAKLTGPLAPLAAAFKRRSEIDRGVEGEVSVVYVEELPGHRMVFCPTGPLTRDYDDVRRFDDAAQKGIKRALKSGARSLLLVRAPDESYPYADVVTVLGALYALYSPIEVREALRGKSVKADLLGVWGTKEDEVIRTVTIATGLERGRFVCRDIGGSDPERMAAPQVAEYVKSVFKDSPVTVNVLETEQEITNEFPLLAAVNRAARGIGRHTARVIMLTYTGDGPIDATLMLVGKGVTYDTGGADIKAGGVMAGMHRDKCGAAAVAGFFKTLATLQPRGLKVVGALAMVRNSIGPDSYVSDEIITSRSGLRIRIGNTDAEGRMAMGDLLCLMREQAGKEVNPHLYTVATLTGHACLAVGDGYSIVVDNGPARQDENAQKLQKAGEGLADPFEISTMRREDYAMNLPKSEYEDLIQCNNLPSSRTPRGHQFPAAFLVQVSGLDKHGIDSEYPIKYSHLDIAASSGPFPGVPTGAPIPALTSRYVLPRL